MKMTLDKLENQVLLWNKAAIVAPILFTTLLLTSWLLSLANMQTLFFIACALYFLTAIIWWWWTMKSIYLLVQTLTQTKEGVIEVAQELKNIRKELQVDNRSDN